MDRRDMQVIEMLREHHEGANVDITYGPPGEFPKARRVADLFQLAGWECTFNDTAQGTITGYPYREGIEVSGFTKSLVEHVSEALEVLGMNGVRTSLRELKVRPENPKYQYTLGRVYVNVEHLPPSRSRWSRSMTRSEWLQILGIVVAVLALAAGVILGVLAL